MARNTSLINMIPDGVNIRCRFLYGIHRGLAVWVRTIVLAAPTDDRIKRLDLDNAITREAPRLSTAHSTTQKAILMSPSSNTSAQA